MYDLRLLSPRDYVMELGLFLLLSGLVGIETVCRNAEGAHGLSRRGLPKLRVARQVSHYERFVEIHFFLSANNESRANLRMLIDHIRLFVQDSLFVDAPNGDFIRSGFVIR